MFSLSLEKKKNLESQGYCGSHKKCSLIDHQFCNSTLNKIDSFNHNISMEVLLTVLYTFPMVLTRRICPTISVYKFSILFSILFLWYLQGEFVQQHQYASSPYCSLYFSYSTYKENLSIN